MPTKKAKQSPQRTKKEDDRDQGELFATEDLVKAAWSEHCEALAKPESKQDNVQQDVEMADGDDENRGSPKARKRKKDTTNDESQQAETKSSSTSKNASPIQILKFLLSDKAQEICRPDEELSAIQSQKDLTTYSNLLSPFEELLCAVVLSRPISHRLGLRTIRTVLNPPYSFNSPEAVTKAGSEKVHQALWDAKTQHKDKTANEIELIAEAVTSNDWGANLKKLREMAKEDVEEEREILRKSIKGLGKTGLNIFYRRIQWQWEEAYPFVDERTKSSLEGLGLPGDAWELVELIENNWDDLKNKVEAGDEKEAQRMAFVVVLERAVGGDLEKKMDVMLEEAKKL